jgi:radical SAM protein with 4Fe4S-binding SPASM domain
MKAYLPYVIFEITSDCNLNCRYCYNIWKMPDAKDPSLNSYKQARKTLSRLFNIANLQHVTFTGGEPFMAERIEELVLYVRMKKKSVTMITNGSSANEERYHTMTKLGVDLFEIPIHSAQAQIHDAMTRVKGSWMNSIHSIKTLLAMDAEVVPVVVITKLNVAGLRETLALIKSLGLRRIMLNRYNIGGEGLREHNQILTGREELKKTYALANELSQELDLDLSSNVCTPFCLLNPKDYPNIAFGSCSTDAKRLPITIDITGNLRLCNHSPIVAGNIFASSIEAIFNSAHAKNWLKTTPKYCETCEVYEKCLGGCRAASLQAGFPGDVVDPVITFEQPDI